MQTHYSPEHNPAPKNGVILNSSLQPEEEQEELIAGFVWIQQILKLYGIEIDVEDELKDPTIKDKMYAAMVNELKNGSTYALEVMVGEKLLSQEDLRVRGANHLKAIAFGFLENTKGVQRKREQTFFIDAGILTEEEIRDHFYIVKNKALH